MRRHPSFNRSAVVNPQVIHNENNLATCILGQPAEKIDENGRVETVAINHPAHFALIGHRGDQVN